MATLVDLPTDILYIIFPYLDATDFLALTSCTKSLHTYCHDANFWRFQTRTTFRIPPQPLLQANGARWQWLYRKLRTQTQLYTWGSNGCGNLGHGFPPAFAIDTARRSDAADSLDANVRSIGWPKKVELDDMSEHIGIVADVQCGGWSTTLLNSVGNLYICGGIGPTSAFMTRSVHRRHNRSGVLSEARQLTFPSAYPPTSQDRYEPSTAISRFSTGRAHVLGLADDGKVWQWNTDEARLVKPLHVDVGEKNVTRVVAGWDRASMFVSGVGIIYWPHETSLRDGNAEADAILIETATIPGTSFAHSRHGRDRLDTLEARIGQVINHIVLENYIVFITSLNKVFFYQAHFPLPDLDPPAPIELTAIYPPSTDAPFEIRDIQGSFRSFAIFTTSGSVLIGTRAMIEAVQSGTYDPISANASDTQPRVIPALQNSGVTSIAFGDYHYQALRSDGSVIAHGGDPESCGAMGLGLANGTGPLRGVLEEEWNGTLGPNVGRQVWFDPWMHRWLGDMKEKAKVKGEAKARGEMILERGTHGRDVAAAAVTAVGDYFEREGRKWEDEVVEEGGMGSYFVLKVAAAGWHSAALVLVDEEQAERARQKHIAPDGKGDGAKAEGSSEHDHHEGTWEDIDAPWDQLWKALAGVGEWLWRFLGMHETDERIGAEPKKAEVEQEEQGDRRKYTWSDQPFPRLRMANGQVMPGEIEVTQ